MMIGGWLGLGTPSNNTLTGGHVLGTSALSNSAEDNSGHLPDWAERLSTSHTENEF